METLFIAYQVELFALKRLSGLNTIDAAAYS
jgi:hypothetical protein